MLRFKGGGRPRYKTSEAAALRRGIKQALRTWLWDDGISLPLNQCTNYIAAVSDVKIVLFSGAQEIRKKYPTE